MSRALVLCPKLRAAGQTDSLVSLVEAGRAHSHHATRFRVEGALGAFAAGDEVTARRLIDDDLRAVEILEPLFAATAPTPAARDVPAGHPPGRRALHHAAAAVAATRAGDFDEARKRVGRVPKELGKPLAVAMLRQAITLAKGSNQAPSAARRLCRNADLVSCAPTFLGELARTHPFEASWEARRRRLPGAASLEAGRLAQTDPTQAALQLARDAGAEAFGAEHAANAALYEGFVWLGDDPHRSERALARALSEGADLIETYRGQMLHASMAGDFCADCGHRHGSDPAGEARAAERVGKALAAEAAAAPLAASAFLTAAEAWSRAGDPGRVQQALARVRTLGDERACFEADLGEATAMLDRNPGRAEEMFEALTARAPSHVESWMTLAALASMRGDVQRAARVAQEGLAATGDPELARFVRQTRAQLGELEPFAGCSPGSLSAGQIAGELLLVVRAAGEAAPGQLAALMTTGPAYACASVLPDAERRAVDLAALYIADQLEVDLGPLFDGLVEHRRAPAALEEIALATACLECDELVLAAADRAVEGGRTDDAVALLRGLARAGERSSVDRRLRALAPQLSRSQMRRLESALGVRPGDPMRVFLRAAEPLAPDFDLFDDDQYVEPPVGMLDGPSMLEQMWDDFGLPWDKLERLTPEARLELETMLRAAMMAVNPLDALASFAESLNELAGVDMRRGPAPPRTKRAPDSKSRTRQKNAAKQKRRQRRKQRKKNRK